MHPFDLMQGVGRDMPNLPADVKLVRDWLNRWAPVLHRITVLETALPSQLHQAIEHFQREVLGEKFPSGKVQPGDRTARKLQETPRQPLPTDFPPTPPVGALPMNPSPGTPLHLPPRTGYESITLEQFKAAADTLGCEVSVIQALGDAEGKGHGFDHFNRPLILFEPLHFRRLSQHSREYALSYPDLTHLHPKPHRYGPDSLQWKHLQQAYLLSPQAALKATSWGRFQAVAEFYPLNGFGPPELMVTNLCQSEQNQLDAFVAYCQSKHLTHALASRDWKAIAFGYNGRGYQDNDYDGKIQRAYKAYAP